MVLKQFYEQKKEKINSIINANGNVVQIGLYNERIFDSESSATPVIMFKYNNVVWNTSSEQEYKADVDFSVYVVLNTAFNGDYLESFDLAKQIDDAILLHPNKLEIRQNREALNADVSTIPLVTNSAFKIKECLHTVNEDHWEKNNFYIWEINYKTTLIEREYKKRYTMISNDFFTESDIDGNAKEAALRTNLRALGYDLDNYYQVQHNGKNLLVYKDVEEQLSVNDLKNLALDNETNI